MHTSGTVADSGIYAVPCSLYSVCKQLRNMRSRSVRCSQAELHLGISNRAVAATRMNASSSRSHAIFTIHVQQRRLVPSATPSPAPSDDGSSPSSPLRTGSSLGPREADMVEELVEAHMVFVDLAGML